MFDNSLYFFCLKQNTGKKRPNLSVRGEILELIFRALVSYDKSY